MSEVSMIAGGYRYGGTLTDAPVRRKPYRRSPLAARVLEVIGDLGGEASVTEIRAVLEETGTVLGGRRGGRCRVPDTLHQLAKAPSPAVTPVGSTVGGRGKAQRWRLERVRASAGLPARRRCSSCGYYRTGQCKTACGGAP
jgi:hypothetical protein